ncbi:hypothetical protein KIPB_011099, partial [Kipferlia bialata]|eukprot:g11099.t1
MFPLSTLLSLLIAAFRNYEEIESESNELVAQLVTMLPVAREKSTPSSFDAVEKAYRLLSQRMSAFQDQLQTSMPQCVSVLNQASCVQSTPPSDPLYVSECLDAAEAVRDY